MGLFSPSLGQVALNVAILVNRATLVYKPAAYPLLERLDDSLAPVRDKEDLLRYHQPPTLQLRQKRLTDLTVLGRPLPKPQHLLPPREIKPQSNNEGLSSSMDRVKKNGKTMKALQTALPKLLELCCRRLNEMPRD